uniref:Uncharacterized protein n=1 Tax=Peronospora matthiolae TaxID=2874970 RepID=A0AAV1UN34_9STRA
MLTTKSMLLTIIHFKCETSVAQRFMLALFVYLKPLGGDVVTQLFNIFSKNGF